MYRHEAKYFISTKDLYQARMSLRRAALDYERTETWKDLASCLYMEARVAHALDDADHDDVQARYERAQAQYDAALVAPCPSTLDGWVQLVRRLGAFSRRRAPSHVVRAPSWLAVPHHGCCIIDACAADDARRGV